MTAAAHAIADPKPGNCVTTTWDFMTSRDALSAMLRKASIEIGSDYLSDKTGELLTDEHERKAVFDSLRMERRQAVNMLERGSPTAAQSEQLKIVIDHANQTMAQIYRVEKVADTARGEVIGQATDKLATALLGPAAGESEGK
jgi:transcriptional regulator GlxA family with amidase domain